nr:DEAD/DEAH box helicase family protein [Actinomycetota bacterium]
MGAWDEPGLWEELVTDASATRLRALPGGLVADLQNLRDVEAGDRLSRHVAGIVARLVDGLPQKDRATQGVAVLRAVIDQLTRLAADREAAAADLPVDGGRMLHAIERRLPTGEVERIGRPLTPLLDTTVLTNAPGEPALAHELRAEVASASSIDVIMAFIRRSGIQPLLEVLRRHAQSGRRLRVLTTTYTGSTEARALDDLADLGAEIKVSYDIGTTRLHAKAWLFHRSATTTTAYLGSSNLTQTAQFSGVEWNVRVSAARNPDVVAKMAAVFESYWEGREFSTFDPVEFRERTGASMVRPGILLAPIELELRPFQEALLERVELARSQGRHRNLLVAATGTGKTVMAAVDYARLRSRLSRSRLLFVAHRSEILRQSQATFRYALRDGSFGELWVDDERPVRFDHVFASVQSLAATGPEALDAHGFDVVVIDEFHHAAAPTYRALLDHLEPVELLGLTATPERADGLPILSWFDGRIAAELRLWDAIADQHLVPFAYYGIHDGSDLRSVPWRRGQGYDPNELTDLLTADHAWAHRILDQVGQKVTDPARMRALGFCVGVTHARFMATRFVEAGLPAVAITGTTPAEERRRALEDLAAGRITAVFTVDLFNEGIDVPSVDTLLFLRPTDSPTLFLQQLGRGLRRSHDKAECTVLDFVGRHRQEFRFDRRFGAL